MFVQCPERVFSSPVKFPRNIILNEAARFRNVDVFRVATAGNHYGITSKWKWPSSSVKRYSHMIRLLSTSPKELVSSSYFVELLQVCILPL
ncbi:hypothetical protein C5167_048041 [Papaver somniferum]|uniref:Uncharacterized protein n=1 Tax=Papaver somniferum TaxID=3469 RepID=A0A4Y7KKU0_PAPSO|nr:hypothetical protein C5167_048041 [Papaver somniferum]